MSEHSQTNRERFKKIGPDEMTIIRSIGEFRLALENRYSAQLKKEKGSYISLTFEAAANHGSAYTSRNMQGKYVKVDWGKDETTAWLINGKDGERSVEGYMGKVQFSEHQNYDVVPIIECGPDFGPEEVETILHSTLESEISRGQL